MAHEILTRTMMGIRESTQSSGFSLAENQRHAQALLASELPPPCHFIADRMLNFLPQLQDRKDLYVEIPNPCSCPSAAQLGYLIFLEAGKLGVLGQLATHVRFRESDVDLAALCGAKRVHLFGNSSNGALENGSGRSIKSLIDDLEIIARKAPTQGITDLRASLEHAPDTNIEKVVLFIRAINYLNRHLDIPVITGVGLPDTNGQADVLQYKKILEAVKVPLIDSNLTLHVHLHDDNKNAISCLKTIQEFTEKEGISVIVEAVDHRYPGERVGLRPHYNELVQLGLPAVSEDYSFLEGSTWVDDENSFNDPNRRQGVLSLHVAGVHTHNMIVYQNGSHAFPHPGLYSIMGSRNIGFLLEQLRFNITEKDDEWLKAAALVAREYAAQFGNQDQGTAIVYAKIVMNDPFFIQEIVKGFGPPCEWLTRTLPDLESLNERLRKERDYRQHRQLRQYNSHAERKAARYSRS